jgi:hypothetical protein
MLSYKENVDILTVVLLLTNFSVTPYPQKIVGAGGDNSGDDDHDQ